MLNLQKLQDEIQTWRMKNFPGSTEEEQYMGIVEELGELSHAILKRKQRIRITDIEDEKDAIGDMLIYTLSYCAERGFSMEDILASTWIKVSGRNWIKFPKNGLTE